MLLGVAIFNPLIAYVVLSAVPVSEVIAAKDFILAEVALVLGGMPLLGLVAIDAFLVLCGAVLTSYVGVSGLIKRMSLDECLPEFLLQENEHGSNPRILIMFFALCTSILLVTKGNLLSLAGVYAISFLGVMTMFAMGNLILRKTRPELKRTYRAPLLFVLIAAGATALGILGNAAIDFNNVFYFLMYFIPALAFVMIVIFKDKVLRYLMGIFKFSKVLHKWLDTIHKSTLSSKYYIFIHHANRLYPTLKYVHDNETGTQVRIVHCDGDAEERDSIKRLLPALSKAGVFPHFKIDFDYLPEEFGPLAIAHYSKKRHIHRNRIFIGAIHGHHDFDYEDLGGVRIILD